MDPRDSVLSFTTSLISTRYTTAASLAFLIYDHVLTFDAEKESVWCRPWSFGTVLFLFNRYFGLFALAFNFIVLFYTFSIHGEFCEVFRLWEGIAVIIAVISAEVILMARIYAVYDRNKRILIVMALLFATNITSTVLIVFEGPPGGTLVPTKTIAGCFVVDRGASYFLCWIPAFVFETILFFMMLFRGWRAREGGINSPLFNVIVRDSILYFLVIFAALFVDCLVWGLSPQTFNVELTGCWTIAASCAFGSRLLLNIRERYFKKETYSDTTYKLSTDDHV